MIVSLIDFKKKTNNSYISTIDKNNSIVDNLRSFFNSYTSGNAILVTTSKCWKRAQKPCKFDRQTTFGDLDCKPLKLDKLKRPYNRCLNLQARLAYTKALKKDDIDTSYDLNDFWSEGWSSLQDKMDLFQQSIQNCDQNMTRLLIFELLIVY
jgi:hypothetical protein